MTQLVMSFEMIFEIENFSLSLNCEVVNYLEKFIDVREKVAKLETFQTASYR